jgi:hypothetical protein
MKTTEHSRTLAGATGSAKLTAAQKELMAKLTHEWARVSPHTKAGTLLSLRDKGIIEGRGNPSYGMACMEMQYNSAAWQWRIKPNNPGQPRET